MAYTFRSCSSSRTNIHANDGNVAVVAYHQLYLELTPRLYEGGMWRNIATANGATWFESLGG